MNRTIRVAIVAGIIIAVAVGATIAAVTTARNEPQPPIDNNNAGNNTAGEGRNLVVELNESFSVDAK